jgi:pyruvate dehydrogenase E2 component (dihydrolipoamide acetyltransferase)
VASAIVMPSFGMYTVEGTVVRWLKPSGAPIEAGEPVLEIETDKALADVVAPEAGLLHHLAEPGEVVQVESLLGYVLEPGEAVPSRPEPETSGEAVSRGQVDQAPPLAVPTPGGSFASPNARRVAAELGVDLVRVTGTGPAGRITESDVRAAAGEGPG